MRFCAVYLFFVLWTQQTVAAVSVSIDGSQSNLVADDGIGASGNSDAEFLSPLVQFDGDSVTSVAVDNNASAMAFYSYRNAGTTAKLSLDLFDFAYVDTPSAGSGQNVIARAIFTFTLLEVVKYSVDGSYNGGIEDLNDVFDISVNLRDSSESPGILYQERDSYASESFAGALNGLSELLGSTSPANGSRTGVLAPGTYTFFLETRLDAASAIHGNDSAYASGSIALTLTAQVPEPTTAAIMAGFGLCFMCLRHADTCESAGCTW